MNKRKILASVGVFLSRSFILVGLPLLAWGIHDLTGFFANPARFAFTIIVVIQALVHAWLKYFIPAEPQHEHQFDMARWHAHLFEIIFIVSAYGDRRDVLAWDEILLLRWIGLGIYLVGVAISISANLTWINHLRKAVEPPCDHPVLLTEGLYKFIRYPGMLALFFYCLGNTIAFRSWIGLALMLALVGGIINRIDNVEKVFARQYKAEWKVRQQSSKRIIPFIY